MVRNLIYYLISDPDTGKKTPIPVRSDDDSATMRWANWFEDSKNRKLARDRIGDILVSTVFLGIDHRFMSEDLPVLFQTMVCADGVKMVKGRIARYSTWEEALDGHKRMVEEVKETLERHS